ncbi:hypothetical protein [Streptomyces zhihengii]
MTASGPENLYGTSGSDAVTDVAVPPGNSTFGETGGPEGYRPAGWACEGPRARTCRSPTTESLLPQVTRLHAPSPSRNTAHPLTLPAPHR